MYMFVVMVVKSSILSKFKNRNDTFISAEKWKLFIVFRVVYDGMGETKQSRRLLPLFVSNK